ncbi:hypothetical protein [Rheinheimera baltica]|uniref:hypothetical protein n=1 Tax=Rheinheimera baltica TaxID=67576 RepID=UPI000405B41E|nr:hypothetical protein [Rheinheimera baltica]
MQKSIVHLVKELSALLLRYPALVTRFERKEPQALAQLGEWLNGAEQLLSSYGIVSVAELAGLRSKLLHPGYHDDHRGSLRKQQLKQAVDMLYDVQHCVQQALTPHQQKLQQSQELLRQLLSMVSQSKAIQYDGHNFNDLVQQVWQLICQHEQLKAGAVQLRSWLSSQDIILLLAEEINPADFV